MRLEVVYTYNSFEIFLNIAGLYTTDGVLVYSGFSPKEVENLIEFTNIKLVSPSTIVSDKHNVTRLYEFDYTLQIKQFELSKGLPSNIKECRVCKRDKLAKGYFHKNGKELTVYYPKTGYNELFFGSPEGETIFHIREGEE
ncbi:hypothetical protein [Bacillus toyonensis]|uniref:hypothetical protein n=1 Tax=Bacillus toyonensis TaxID=155322 RepID=UPI00211D9B4F|nr:hypothetical protein [Bacillus toyonensis]